MATQIPQPTIHIYKEVNIGKFKSVKHYELLETNFKPILTKLINISKDRNCAQSMPEYWLKLHNGKNWNKCLTGLFKTEKKNIFKGDAGRKKHLIVFKFSNNAESLTVIYFQNYYTRDLNNIWHLINE